VLGFSKIGDGGYVQKWEELGRIEERLVKNREEPDESD